MGIVVKTRIMEAFLEFISDLDNLKNIAIIIGAPAAIVSFFKLLKRDKKKDQLIDSLGQIAEHQDSQITELKRSVEQLALIAEYQNTFNAMYAEGLEIAKDKQKFEQDLEKLKLRPEFGFNGSTNNMYRFKNVGENADIISVDILEGINAISLHGIIKEQTTQIFMFTSYPKLASLFQSISYRSSCTYK